MGIRIGTKEYTDKHLEDTCIDLETSFDTVDRVALVDPQIAKTFLTSCLHGRLNFLLRGMMPEDTGPIVALYSRRQAQSLSLILAVEKKNMSLLTERVAKLPSNDGGIGLCNPELSVDPAYVAGFAASIKIITEHIPEITEMLHVSHTDNPDIPRGVRSFLQAVRRLNALDPSVTVESIVNMKADDRHKLQHKLSLPARDRCTKNLIDELSSSRDPDDIRHLAMLLSGQGSAASAWVRAVPKTDKTTMSPAIYREALRSRLLVGKPNHIEGEICPCSINRKKKVTLDPWGDHTRCCKLSNVQTVVTHTRLTGAIKEFMTVTVGTTVDMEPQRGFAKADPMSESRLDLKYITIGGKDQGYDATVANAIQADLTWKKAKVAGRAAADAEKRKKLVYDNICERNDINFIPIAYETGGRPGALWVKEMNRMLAMHPDGGHPGFRNYFDTNISVALQTGIANASLTREAHRTHRASYRASGGKSPEDVSNMIDLGSYCNTRDCEIGRRKR